MSRWSQAVGAGCALVVAVGAVVGLGAIPAGASGGKPKVTTIASGFDNPRGLAFGSDGQLYVAEAGKGGPKCVSGGPGGGNLCPGLTGAISVIDRHQHSHHRIVSGLASVSDMGGTAATGPDGLAFDDGRLFTVMTSCPQQVAQLPPNTFSSSLVSALEAQAGRVIRLHHNGTFQRLAGVGAFDWNFTNTHKNLVPGQFPDCNPYGIFVDDETQWVIDAASNTLDRVEDGHIRVVAFFPNPPVSDAVPTCVAKGPDGALYVGELTGGGNKPGASVVWRVDINDKHPTPKVWATGLTAVTGCGFADGKFYATEFSTLGLDNAAPGTGAVVQVRAHSHSPIVIVDKLSFPNGFAARHDSIYVSNWSIAPAIIPTPGPPFQPGSVVRIDLQ